MDTFEIKTKHLTEIVDRAQDRKFCEDIDVVDQAGGEAFLIRGLKTDAKLGISGTEKDLHSRDIAFGNNRKAPTLTKSFFDLLIDALGDETLKILMVAAAVSIIIEVSTSDHPETAWIEGFAIFVAVGVCSSVTAVNDY